MQPKIEDLNKGSETQFIAQSFSHTTVMDIEIVKEGTYRSTSSFCPKKGQILHDNSCGTWATTTSPSSQSTQQVDNCSKFALIGQSTYHTTMSLSEMLYCNQTLYPHERVEFGHETTWPLHSSIDSNLYQIGLNNIETI